MYSTVSLLSATHTFDEFPHEHTPIVLPLCSLLPFISPSIFDLPSPPTKLLTEVIAVPYLCNPARRRREPRPPLHLLDGRDCDERYERNDQSVHEIGGAGGARGGGAVPSPPGSDGGPLPAAAHTGGKEGRGEAVRRTGLPTICCADLARYLAATATPIPATDSRSMTPALPLSSSPPLIVFRSLPLRLPFPLLPKRPPVHPLAWPQQFSGIPCPSLYRLLSFTALYLEWLMNRSITLTQ